VKRKRNLQFSATVIMSIKPTVTEFRDRFRFFNFAFKTNDSL
jgi:hypothetical protein